MGKKSLFRLNRQFRHDDGSSYPADQHFVVRGVWDVTIQAALAALDNLPPVLLETLLVYAHMGRQRKDLHRIADVFEKAPPPHLHHNPDITTNYTDQKGRTWESITEKPRLKFWQNERDEKKRTYYDAERHPAVLLDKLAGELVMGPSWRRHHYEHSLSIPLDNPVKEMRYRTSFSPIFVTVPKISEDHVAHHNHPTLNTPTIPNPFSDNDLKCLLYIDTEKVSWSHQKSTGLHIAVSKVSDQRDCIRDCDRPTVDLLIAFVYKEVMGRLDTIKSAIFPASGREIEDSGIGGLIALYAFEGIGLIRVATNIEQKSIAEKKLLMRGPLDALRDSEDWRNDDGKYGSVLKRTAAIDFPWSGTHPWLEREKEPSWLDVSQREGLKITETMLQRLELELDVVRKRFGLPSCQEAIQSMQNYFLSHGEECAPDHYALMADTEFFEENTDEWELAVIKAQEGQRVK